MPSMQKMTCHATLLPDPKMENRRVEGQTCQHADAGPTLPVPYPDGLIVTGRDHPRILLMKLHCTDIVQMPQQGEETPSKFVIPHLQWADIQL